MEAIIFVGIQASGKSTFYRERFLDTHLRISMDLMRTRNREKIFLRACLEAKMKFVVDNTNPTKGERAAYIAPALESGFRVIGYAFGTSIDDAIARNESRIGVKKISIAGVRGTRNKLEWPTFDEGFDDLKFVRLEPNGHFTIQEWSNEV